MRLASISNFKFQISKLKNFKFRVNELFSYNKQPTVQLPRIFNKK